MNRGFVNPDMVKVKSLLDILFVDGTKVEDNSKR